MRTRTRFIYNTTLLTLSGLLMRCVGCAFQVWLAGRIGPGGIGLYQLMGSVGGFAMTVAISGIGFGSMRLVSEELGRGSLSGARAAVLRCCLYALVCGTAAGWALYHWAEPVGFLWIKDGRTVLPLEIMALELPFVSLSSVFSGWFTARARVGRTTVLQLCQQLLTVWLTVWFLSRVPIADIAANCACITLAGTISEAAGCVGMGALYLLDSRSQKGDGTPNPGLCRRMLSISLPLAVSAYTRSGLSTLQHMLTPIRLRTAGMTAAQALSAYGMVHGMALTVLYFPTCILYVVAQLLIPQLTEMQVRQRHRAIDRLCGRILGLGIVYAGAVALGLLVLAGPLAQGMYGEEQVAVYLRMLVPLVPVIYLDILVDGCLKGLGQQLWSMGINIAESAVSVVLTWVLVGRFGIGGYVAVIWFNEVFNFALSLGKLLQIIGCQERTQEV